jgi:hypothetical protein
MYNRVGDLARAATDLLQLECVIGKAVGRSNVVALFAAQLPIKSLLTAARYSIASTDPRRLPRDGA